MANREVKINEFLCFVQNKIDILDDLSVVQICESNFKESVIENGKSELYGLIPESGRCILRKGEDKKKKDIKDVIKVNRPCSKSRMMRWNWAPACTARPASAK